MAITIKKNQLSNFSKRLQIDVDGLKDNLADEFAKRGEKIAKSLYKGEKIAVEATNLGDGKSKIVSRGENVAYLEFGTGIQGENAKYPNPKAIPTHPLKFESPKGVPRETQGWVYNYMKKLYDPKKADFVGQKHQAQMFYTGQELKAQKVAIVKNVLRRSKNG